MSQSHKDQLARQYHLDDEALNDIVRKVEDAWFSILRSEPTPWPIKVFGTYMIVEDDNGLARVEYTVSDEGAVEFGAISRVEQVFVAARDPNPLESKHPLRKAQDLMQRAGRFGIDGLRAMGFHSSTGEGSPELGQTSKGSPTPSIQYAADDMRDGDAIFMQSKLTVYSDNDERYVGGVVLEPGDDNAYGDIWEAEDIRIMSQRFMEGSQHMDWMHTTQLVAKPVESVYFPTVEEGGQAKYQFWGEEIDAGSWWLGSRVTNDAAWKQVKAGELTGFSIFAIKGGSDVSSNAKYGVGGPAVPAPEGRKMSHKDWSITMVALVDAPAVKKATYVTMRRAPEGSAQGVAYSDRTGGDLPTPVLGQVSKLLYQINQAEPQGDMMKRIAEILAYADQENGAGTLEVEKEVVETPTEGANIETPADKVETPTETPTETPADKVETPDEGPSLASISAQITTFTDGQPAMIDLKISEAMKPFDDRMKALESRSNRQSGVGSLPGLNGVTGEEEDGETPKIENDWVNYGMKPSPQTRSEETSRR